MALFVFHEVVIRGWDVGFLGALQAVGVFAVGDDADDGCVREGGGVAGIDEGL